MFDLQGLITKVLHAEAGLYEIDGKVGLCLAYQPLQECGGGLRPGAEIQVSVMSDQSISNVQYILSSSTPQQALTKN